MLIAMVTALQALLIVLKSCMNGFVDLIGWRTGPSSFELHVAVYGACVVFEMQFVAGFNSCCVCIVLYYLHWQ